MFLVLAGMSMILYLVLTLATRFPHTYNYMVPITAENAAVQYRLAREIFAWIKPLMLGMQLYLQWVVIKVATNTAGGLNPWVMLTFVGALFALLAINMVRSVRAR